MRTALAIALVLLALGGRADDAWTATDTAFELAGATLHLIDWSQTLSLADEAHRTYMEAIGCPWPDNPRLLEANPILGTRPSRLEVHTYFSATLLAHAAIAYVLPHPYRRIWQATWIGVEGGCVGHNLTAGVSFALP